MRVGPMTCARAAPPTRMSSGLRAHQGVCTHNQGLTCEQHTTTDTVVPKTQTTSQLAARIQRFSPRWSVFWALSPSTRPLGGGITPFKGATRRRHADRALRMAQNPHRPLVWREWRPGGPGCGDGGGDGAWPRHISHVISDGHFLRPPKTLQFQRDNFNV